MRLIYSIVFLAVVAGGIGVSLQAKGSDGPMGAFLATSYAAISGNVEGLFGSVVAMMGMSGSATPPVPRASIQSVETDGVLASAAKTVSGWFGAETETKPRIRSAPGTSAGTGVSMVTVGQ